MYFVIRPISTSVFSRLTFFPFSSVFPSLPLPSHIHLTKQPPTQHLLRERGHVQFSCNANSVVYVSDDKTCSRLSNISIFPHSPVKSYFTSEMKRILHNNWSKFNGNPKNFSLSRVIFNTSTWTCREIGSIFQCLGKHIVLVTGKTN